MPYLSLYRKYRSQTFEEVSGQDHVTRTLQNAVRSGRVAHAYLFCGPRGTGKTTTARLLAKALNCEGGPTPEPCNQCAACTQITEGRYLDMTEIDAASNRGIEEIRHLRERVGSAAAHGRYKVYVIDEAHQITTDAFNAFLKTLEEPPPHVVFIMATTDAQKIPATIVSRCQRFEFRRASLPQLRDRVAWVAEQEGATVEDAALDLIARDANGGWRDALSLLEQVLAFSGGAVTARDVYTVLGTVEAETLHALGESLLRGDGAEVILLLDELISEGKDPRQLLRDVTGFYRGLMLAAAGSPPPGDREHAQRTAELARGYGLSRLVAAIEVLAQTEREARWSEQPRLLLELALFRLMQPTSAGAAAPEARAPEPAQRPQPAPAAREPAPPPRRPERVEAPALRPTPAPAEEEPPLPEPPPDDPFFDDPREVPAAPARAAASAPGYGGRELAKPPLTVGDARTGHRDDDEDPLALFSTPPAAPEGGMATPRGYPAPAEGGSPEPEEGGPAPSPRPAAAPPSTAAAPLPPSAFRPPPSGAAPDLDLVRRKWRVVLEELKRDRKATIQACLADTQPARFAGDELVISFTTKTMWELFTTRGKAFSDPVAQAVHRVTGIQCRVRAEQKSEAAGAAPARKPAATGPSLPGTEPAPPPAAPAAAASNGPARPAPPPPSPPAPGTGSGDELVHNVIEVFDGRIVDHPEQD